MCYHVISQMLHILVRRRFLLLADQMEAEVFKKSNILQIEKIVFVCVEVVSLKLTAYKKTDRLKTDTSTTIKFSEDSEDMLQMIRLLVSR